MDTQEKIKVMQAYVDGRPIQRRLPNDTNWSDTSIPIWNWHDCQYRIKPNKQPLTPADFPPGTVIREKDALLNWRIVNMVSYDSFWAYPWKDSQSFISESLMNDFEYSTDQGKTWKPCYK